MNYENDMDQLVNAFNELQNTVKVAKQYVELAIKLFELEFFDGIVFQLLQRVQHTNEEAHLALTTLIKEVDMCTKCLIVLPIDKEHLRYVIQGLSDMIEELHVNLNRANALLDLLNN